MGHAQERQHMKLKTDSNGNAVLKDGKPVYVHHNGQEVAVDVAGTMKALNHLCFANSKFVAEKCSIPADVMRAQFSDSFRVEDGKVVAYDGSGNRIYSRVRPGEIADFDEALETIVGGYAYKDKILKPAGAPGAGAGGKQPGADGSKTVTRAQWDQMDHSVRMTHIKTGGVVID
jgi:hypothetical protein